MTYRKKIKSRMYRICAIPERTIVWFIFFLSLTVSLIFLSFFKNIGPAEHQVPGTDYFFRYKPNAQVILTGKGIPLGDNGIEVDAPGYPLILTVIFSLSHILKVNELHLIVFFNILMAAGTACFLFLAAKLVFDKKIALISALLWSTYPLNLWFIKNPNTEAPFMLLLYGAVWMYLLGIIKTPPSARTFLTSSVGIKQKKCSYFFATGILLGLSTLIRPVTFFLPPVLIILLFFLKFRDKIFIKSVFRFAVFLLLGNFLAVLPWISYTVFMTNKFVPIASIGPGIAVSGLSYALVGNGSHIQEVPKDVGMLMKEVRKTPLLSGMDIIKFTLRGFIIHPWALSKLFFLKFVRSWYATYGMWWEKELMILQLPYLTSGAAGIWLALKKYKERRFSIAVFLSLILYFWTITFLGLSIVRYMVPVMGFLIVFSSLIIWRLTFKLTIWRI